MITVTRKDGKESLENLIRRFNRRVQSSNVIAIARSSKRFEKPISKTERRKKAVIRTERRLEKVRKLKLGIR
ncbi:MAG TPA: 30S ribosomal protein S21 [Candidatus Saccharibacteria bacterium]|jgi:ribosomal protein S21|nr:30S ribosomal protein S21 [Candidatus Saccharibacteria bacterium]